MPTEPFDFDNLKRPIVAPEMVLLQAAGRVTVKVDNQGNKVYTIEDEGGA